MLLEELKTVCCLDEELFCLLLWKKMQTIITWFLYFLFNFFFSRLYDSNVGMRKKILLHQRSHFNVASSKLTREFQNIVLNGRKSLSATVEMHCNNTRIADIKNK